MKRLLILIIAITSACVQEIPQDTKPGVCISTGDDELGLIFRPCDSIENDICRYRYLSGYYQASMWETMSREQCLKLNEMKVGG
jgi:hypothetical protein